MNINARSIGSMLCLVAVYIVLGMLGIYHAMEIVLFPIITIPLIVYFIRNRLSKIQHIVFQSIIIIAVYLTNSSMNCVLIYLAGICIPAYVILYLYTEELSLPNIIMYATVLLSAVTLSFFIIMKYMGMDYEAYYLDVLDIIKNISIDDIQEWLLSQNLGLELNSIAQLSLEMKQTMKSVIEIMQIVYSGLIILQLLITTGITVIIVNMIIRRKNKQTHSLVELLNFRLSKISVFILFISTMIIALNRDGLTRWSVLSLNVAFVLMALFQIAGAFSLVAIVSRAHINKGIKILGIITILILLSISPYLVMFFGCLDTIFNYRKVKIVV